MPAYVAARWDGWPIGLMTQGGKTYDEFTGIVDERVRGHLGDTSLKGFRMSHGYTIEDLLRRYSSVGDMSRTQAVDTVQEERP